MADTPAGGFFTRRWRGEVPLARLFWRDMLVAGSLLNLVASFGALMLAAKGAPGAVAAALHFGPLPYNLFLCLALWRHPARRPWQAGVATLWCLAASLL